MNSFIETLNQSGGQFLNFAWPMLWQSSLLIAFVFALDFLLARKIRASVRYALWLAVLVKLILPPTLALPTGAAWWLFQTKPAAAPVTENYTVTYGATVPQMDFVPQTIPMPAPLPPPPPKLDGAGWALLASVTVSAGLLLWLAIRWWQVARIVRSAKLPEEFSSALADARRLAGLRSRARLKLVEGRMSPAVCGLFRPVILLPRTLAEKLSAAQLRPVLLHEMFHLRRKDVWVNCAQSLLQIFYWWHPLLWFANARIRRVREEAVDDAVMLALRDEADGYAPTLLEVAKLAFHRPLMSLGLVGIMESRSALRQRIERLVDFRAPKKAGLTFAALCGIFVFSAVALPMGEGPAQTNNPILPGVSNNLSQTNSSVSNTDDGSRGANSFDEKANADWLVQEAKLNYEMGKMDEAEKLLKSALTVDPENADAKYYLGLVQAVRQGKLGRQSIIEKLNHIRLAQVSFEHLSLVEAVRQLNEMAKQNDPEKVGVPILTATNFDSGQLADLNSVVINWPPPLKDVRLADVMDVVVMVADKPIKYSIQDFGVVFSEKTPAEIAEERKLFTWTFKVDLAALRAGLEEVRSQHFGSQTPTVTNISTLSPSEIAREFFAGLGMNWQQPPGKSIVYNDQSGTLVVTATAEDLYWIEKVIETLNNTAPRNHSIATNSFDDIKNAKLEAKTLVQDGETLYEAGKLEEAQTKLDEALKLDPDSEAAFYYKNLILQAGYNRDGQTHTTATPVTNPYATNDLYTGPGRAEIMNKLNSYRLSVSYEPAVPLSEAILDLSRKIKASDPEKKGILLMINDNLDDATSENTPVAGKEQADIGSYFTIALNLKDARLADVMDAICKAANDPHHPDWRLKYSIKDSGIVFSAKGPYEVALYESTFKVDPHIFLDTLRELPYVGKRRTNPQSSDVSTMFRNAFVSLGVDLDSRGESIVFNDKQGLLFVRATEADLEDIGRVLMSLNPSKPQIHIKMRFVEVPEKGFVWNPTTTTHDSVGPIAEIVTAEDAKTIFKLLEAETGFETLAEPEVTTTSGRQALVGITDMITGITNFAFLEAFMNQNSEIVTDSIVSQTNQNETGPKLDVVPYFLPVDPISPISLHLIPSVTEPLVSSNSGPEMLPDYLIRQASITLQSFITLNLMDGQTAIFRALPEKDYVNGKEVFDKSKSSDKELLIFITATIVDPAGNRFNSDDEMSSPKDEIPVQPNN